MPSRSRNWVIALRLAGLAALIIMVLEWSVRLPSAGEALPTKWPDAKLRQLDLLLDLTKTAMSWGLGLVAGSAFFLKAMVDKDITLKRRELILVELAFGSAILSLVLGYLVISNCITLLQVGQFDVGARLIRHYSAGQQWALVLGLVAFAALCHHFFWRRLHEAA